MVAKVKTIYDLAKIAGVSAATVSRSLAGSSLVNAKTAKKIQELAKTHNYQPNLTARSLRTRRRGAINVVIPLGHDKTQHISDPFFMTLLGNLADELTERGFELILTRIVPEGDGWLETMVAADRVDGFILMGQSDQSAVLDKVAEHYLPLVAWGGLAEGQKHCSVGTDNRLGGRLAISHLIKLGCRDIAFLGNAEPLEISLRLEGAQAAVAEAQSVVLRQSPIHFSAELIGVDLGAFFDGCDRLPDGIFAASDMIAISAIQVLSQRGVRVPQDVKVIGYDDLFIARASTPPLSTIRQDLAAGAKHIVSSLLMRIEGHHTPSIVLPPMLIQRSST